MDKVDKQIAEAKTLCCKAEMMTNLETAKDQLELALQEIKNTLTVEQGQLIHDYVSEALKQVKNCSIPDVGLTLPFPDENSMRQIAQHVRNSEESRDPLIYEQGIIRGMQIMKNIVSGN